MENGEIIFDSWGTVLKNQILLIKISLDTEYLIFEDRPLDG